MLDNEEPWKPPEMQKISQAPKIAPQVPELTIISTENKQNPSKSNFLQRAILTEKNLKPQSSHNDPVRFQPLVGSKDSRFNENAYKKSPTNILKEDNKAYQPISTKPSVPDITILDDDNSKSKSPSSTERVFTNSYKEMMINSHNQFLKQFNKEQSNVNSATKYPTEAATARYKQNPLTKYNPSPEPPSFKPFKDGNSSSILSDIDITKSGKKGNENEEVTFKKVAEMLSEIQKLVIPEKSTQSPSSSNGENSQQQNPSNYEILKQLASTYLSQEELIKYQVDSELNELEKYHFL